MTHHIQVQTKQGEWRSWCQVSPFLTEGETAREQIAMMEKCLEEGEIIICEYETQEQAQKHFNFMKRERPDVILRIVSGPCQRD